MVVTRNFDTINMKLTKFAVRNCCCFERFQLQTAALDVNFILIALGFIGGL